jgi:dihydrolipoamide dehydrogenase
MKYDVLFLGGGPGGYEGAIRAGKLGMKTAVVEMDKLGGTCLQRGCIPTKTLLHTVKSIKQVKSVAKTGISFGEMSVNIEKINKQKDRVVSKLTKGIELLFRENGVDLINGRGKLIDNETVLVNGETEIKADKIIIATGSVPAELPFLKPDGDLIINSNKALELSKIPEKMLVVGAGAIGVEMAVIYTYLGSQVTIAEVMEHIIPGSDVEVSEILKKELGKQKIKIHTATSVSEPVKSEDNSSIKLKFKNEQKEWFDEFYTVLLAVGRRPNNVDIVSDNMSIKFDDRGFIEVDENLKTSEDNIFACGDIIGGSLLAHKASHQAIAIIDYIKTGEKIKHHPVPGAVFTFPEFASVGLSQEQAEEKNIDIKIGKFSYSAGSRSNAIDEKTGLVKIIADTNNVLIGAHIIGAEAGELLPLLSYAVAKKMKADDFKDLICIHPTLSENVWEAIGDIGGFSIHN